MVAQPQPTDLDARVLDQIRRWRDELVDLTRRNPLLNFRRTRSSTLEVLAPSAGDVLAGLSVRSGWRFHYPELTEEEEQDATLADSLAVEDPELTAELLDDELLTDQETASQLSRVLRNLERRSSQEFIDKGLRVLYLGVGLLRWITAQEDELLSPLVLVPVQLQRPSPRDPFRIHRSEEDVVLNPALTVKLEFDHDLRLPELDIDSEQLVGYLDRVRETIADVARWKVEDRVVVRTFTFQKEAMFRDLLDNEGSIAAHPLVRALALGRDSAPDFDFEPIAEADLDRKEPPEQVVSVLDADSTQRKCIAAAKSGQSFVMDGPPGSGKSQTIANIIAELISAGRTVLFTSEKAAALEVVKKRLDEVGLGDYVLELHSTKANRKETAQELGRALRERPRARVAASGADRAKARQRREALSDYADAMNELRSPFRRSLSWAIGRCGQLDTVERAPAPDGLTSNLSALELDEILIAARNLQDAWGPVERGDGFLWRHLRDPDRSRRAANELDVLLAAIAESIERTRALADSVSSARLLQAPSSIGVAQDLASAVALIRASGSIHAPWLTVQEDDALTDRIDARQALAGEYHERVAALRQRGVLSWSEIPIELADEIPAWIAETRGLDPALDLAAQNREALDNLARELESMAARAAEIASTTKMLLAAFGLPEVEPDLELAGEVAELGTLAAAPNRPEAAWLEPGAVAGARKALGVLCPLVDDFRTRAASLESIYRPEVLELDIDALLEQGKPRLSRLSKVGRANRRALSACSQTDRLTSAVIENLAEARAWQASAQLLRTAESEHAEALGSHYFRGVDTDWPTVESAVATAERVLQLVRSSTKNSELGRRLGREANDTEALAPRADALRQRVSAMHRHLSDVVPQASDQLAGRSLVQTEQWAVDAARLVEGTIDALGPVVAVARGGESVIELLEIAQLATRARAIETDMEQTYEADAVAFGSAYGGVNTDWRSLREAIAAAGSVVELLHAPVNQRSAVALLAAADDDDGNELLEVLETLEKLLDEVLEHFELRYAERLRADLEVSFDDALMLVRELRESLADLDEWAAFTAARRELQEQSAGGIADFCIDRRISRDRIPAVAERAALTAWVECVLTEDAERLRLLRAEQHDRTVNEFRELDRMLVRGAASVVMTECNTRRPSTTAGVAATIQTEAAKQRRHMPIRTLLERTAPVAQACKPCFMMSPLSASQFLGNRVRFDVVIFDEASQVRPSDAINAIYRGTQLIVAGDEHQLPPTSFFQQTVDDGTDDYVDEQLEEFESVLDISKGSAGIRSLPLRWHYRSRHESLITYSNYMFYDGRLITYPAAIEASNDAGIEFFHVADGVYHRGGAADNPTEARQVVVRILQHAEDHPTLTLGVVAFSDAQASRIEFELEAARRDRPDLDAYFQTDRLDGFFVKNLENVQGDERDIVIFSVGYGFDEARRFTMQFGPLNRPGGERRLNVAITRARRRVEIVSSVSADDFRDSDNVGVRHLKRYLDYAERGQIALSIPVVDGGHEVESPFEAEVVRTIRRWGFDAVPQVGQAGYRIDIGVLDPARPGRYAIGVECDGAAYHSSRTARDRDRLRQQVLEGLGWTLHRIWGTAWYRNRAREEERLRSAIESAIAGDSVAQSGPPPKMRDVPAHAVEIVELDGAPDWARPYQPARPGLANTSATMDDPNAGRELRRIVGRIVEQEGPIHRELCALRARDAFGARRMGDRMRRAFDGAVNQLKNAGEIQELEAGFLMVSARRTNDVVRAPETPESVRAPRHVPATELEMAVARLVEDARSIDREELSIRVARIFGWNRRGPDVSAAIDAAITSLIERGDLSCEDRLIQRGT
jgi:hypothetical protein